MLRTQLIPACFDWEGPPPMHDNERELLTLPARLKGVGLMNPTKLSASEYPVSKQVTGPLCDLILDQNPAYPLEVNGEQATAKAEVRNHKRHQLSSSATHLKPDLPEPLQRTMELSQ